MEELYKNELQILKDFADKEQYVSLSKIMEVFQNPSEELLDDIVKYLENEGIEITRESEELPDDELLVEKVDDDFDGFGDEIEIDEELQELASVVESEIKVADFDDFVSSSHQADDPVKMYLRDIGQVELLTITQESEFARTVQEGIASKEKIEAFLKMNKPIPYEEMQKLQEKIEQGDQARDILIESNLRLVVSIAKRYLGRG